MADNQRTRRIGELIQREIATLLQREIKDPRLKNVTISAVKVNRDLSTAKVYFSLINPDQSQQQQLLKQVNAGLEKASGFIRMKIGQELILRTVPKLNFIFDESIQYGAMMNDLIDQVIAHDKKFSNNE